MKNLARWRIVGVAIVLMFSASLAGAQEGKIVPYVPTPQDVVERMLELAKVKKGDVVYDLGSGDGRIVVTAAKNMASKPSVSKSIRNESRSLRKILRRRASVTWSRFASKIFARWIYPRLQC